jgi:hypothetical protein
VKIVVTKSAAIVGSLALATLVGAVVFLLARPSAKEELARPAAIPPAMLSVLKTKMGQHDLQMRELMTRVVLLDDDGVARAAGAIFAASTATTSICAAPISRPRAQEDLRERTPTL